MRARFLCAAPPEMDGAEGAHSCGAVWMPIAWRSMLSTTGFCEDGRALVTAGRLHASRAAVRLLRASDQLV
jgi:hypothetical protein